MALYDNYSEFRDPKLSEAEQKKIAEAQEAAKKMESDATLERRPGGFYNEAKGFTPHPVVQAHMGIAVERARAQFEGHPAMPEDAEASIRYPGVDPVGQYGIIDMKFAQREAVIKATLESRAPAVQEYVKGLLDKRSSSKEADAPFNQRQFMMKQSAKTHRELTRASKLCLDEDGRRLLHQQARSMESDLPVEQYDKLLQGIEYAAGVRQGPVPKEITSFYKDTLKTELDMGMVASAQNLSQVPEQLHMDFQDLDNKLLQQSFASPANWGKSPQDVSKAADGMTVNDVASALDPYTMATADRLIDPLFRGMEKDAPAQFQGKAMGKTGAGLDIEFSRGDLISIDGMTVREKMQEAYQLTLEPPEKFEEFYKQNVKEMTNRFVSAGLMAGKRVEAFVPDKYGRIPKEPAQITKTGYEPTPLKPERFNAWQRHFAKHGFYKKKVARQQEYERVMAARERMKEKAATSEQARRFERTQSLGEAVKRHFELGGGSPKELFFGSLMGELGLRTFTTTPEGKTQPVYDWQGMTRHVKNLCPTKLGGTYDQFTRVEPGAACVMGMVAQGYKFEDIMNPDKLQSERQDMVREFMEHAKTNDQEWLGRTYYEGFKATVQQLQTATRGMDLTDDAQLLRTVPMVEAFARTAFSSGQTLDDKDCRLAFYQAAAAEAGGDLEKGSQLADNLFWKIQQICTGAEHLMYGYKAQLAIADPTNANMKYVFSRVRDQPINMCAKGAATWASLDLSAPSLVDSFPDSQNSLLLHGITPADPQVKAVSAAFAKGSNAVQRTIVQNAASGRLMGEMFHVTTEQSMKVIKGESVDTLVKNEDGTFSLKRSQVDRPYKGVNISFHVDKELAPPEKEGPQVQAKHKQAPHKKAPQMGGPRR